MRKLLKAIGVLVIIGVVVGALSKNAPESSNAAGAPVAAVDTSTSQRPPVVPAPDTRPREERRFIELITNSRASYDAAANDMAKGGVRAARASAICSEFKNSQIVGWEGKLNTLSSNSDGKGVIEIEIGPQVTFKTWNNALSDISDHTLIEPGGTLFQTAAALAVGQRVRFSGSLFSNKTDCFHEVSVTQSGAMKSPDFLMRFTDIRAK